MQKDTLLQCHKNIRSYIHRTPILTSKAINGMVGAVIHFKCENFQKGGAYKIRGATNAVLQLFGEQRDGGMQISDAGLKNRGERKDQDGRKNAAVVTHSSGNFAQALSLAAKYVGIDAHIVMPSTAPQVKKDAVAEYSGKIIECEPTLAAREAAAQKIERETGATFIHPSNDENVIIG